jgi:hypothetical protein
VVKTLAIRDTVEEEMLERRAGIVARTTRMPPLTEEAGMRRYIEVSDDSAMIRLDCSMRIESQILEREWEWDQLVSSTCPSKKPRGFGSRYANGGGFYVGRETKVGAGGR